MRPFTDPALRRSLRRYVLSRANGSECTGWTRRVDIGDGIVAWVWCSELEAKLIPATDTKRVRTPGQPWCRWLGTDVSVASDLVLQAALQAVGDDGWAALAAEARRSPSALLIRLTAEGRRLLDAATARPTRGPLHDAYVTRGRGRRSLAEF